ncbi:hypothetical protein [Pseudoalteromonas sp. S16_S37]|uniref:hypothetical protein n=1 Tax=Pseudoalteromonas sp. S16_S37 TaxID=2720228 RepID=UPI00167FE8EE|nr:hypothetical protein [Pseudoalteromonas sp. S16_S37]MBD1583317.1 hypothetical protein [Pseudoalteromonas sp. S16_S37]
MKNNDINALLDALLNDPDVQKEWELNPELITQKYDLTDEQRRCLLDGDVDTLIEQGLAQRHVQQMRVSW